MMRKNMLQRFQDRLVHLSLLKRKVGDFLKIDGSYGSIKYSTARRHAHPQEHNVKSFNTYMPGFAMIFLQITFHNLRSRII
eukprot:8694094-Karenia_brevis.AAC.1